MEVTFMSKLIILTRILLLCLSFYGYLQSLQKKIRLELSIGVLISGIGSIMFLSGILNVMPEASWCIFLCGILLAIRSLKRREAPKDIVAPGTVFVLIAAVVLFLVLFGSKFVYYDNFTHWGVSTRILINNDRFPDATDQNFLFRAYPLGSAAFIYYVVEITGLSAEWFQMYIQVMLSVGMLAGLFAFSKKDISVLLVLFSSVILLCGNIPFVDLLVDTLLPLTALSGIAFCVYYRNELKNRERLLQLIPYTVFLIGIKNSGIFFAAFLIGFAWYSTRYEKVERRNWAAIVLAPASTLLLWHKHVDQVFLHAQPSKHSVSISNYANVFQDKSIDDIHKIIDKMCQYTFTPSNPGFQILLLVLGIWLLWKYVFKNSKRELTDILVFSVASYVVYQVGLMAMYLFSMPIGEALSLAEYSRYHATIMLFLAGLVLLEALEGLALLRDQPRYKFISIAVFCVILLGIFCTVKPDFSYFEKQNTAETERGKLEALIENYGIQPDDDCVILVSSERSDDGYLFFMSRYLHDPELISIKTDADLEEFKWDAHDCIIVFEETEAIRDFLSKELSENYEPVIYLK